MLHVGRPQPRLEDERGVGSDEHCDGSGAARRPRVSLRVDGDVGADGERVPPVPGPRLHPVDAVEEGRGAAIAGVRRVNALHVVIAGGLEQLHERRLHRLRLVHKGLRTDLQSTDIGV